MYHQDRRRCRANGTLEDLSGVDDTGGKGPHRDDLLMTEAISRIEHEGHETLPHLPLKSSGTVPIHLGGTGKGGSLSPAWKCPPAPQLDRRSQLYCSLAANSPEDPEPIRFRSGQQFDEIDDALAGRGGDRFIRHRCAGPEAADRRQQLLIREGSKVDSGSRCRFERIGLRRY